MLPNERESRVSISQQRPTTMNERRPGDVVPVRMTVNLCMAISRDRYNQGRHFEQIDDALAACPHILNEGGSAAIMDAADVIPCSPLDDLLQGPA